MAKIGSRPTAAVIAAVLALGASAVWAQDPPAATPQTVAAPAEEVRIGPVTKLPVPRYVSLRSKKINVRRGPGLDYRKDWVFTRAGWPVQVVDEYGNWRRIVDIDDAGGWVYHAMITGRRTVVVTEDLIALQSTPETTAEPVARAQRGVVADLGACNPTWCEIEAEGYSGWVPKSAIWGVKAEETRDR